jgi:nucleoside-diphosphate-sugar epimerase
VNVSSFAVYSNRTLARGAVLDESAPLEDAFQERFDAYGYGKLKQEEVVRQYGRTHGLRYVILRPGTVFGPGKKDLTGRIGVSTFGFFIHVGGSNALPLTYVDNCADAIVLAGTAPGAEGGTFNVVDDDTLTSAQFLRAYKRSVPRFFSLRLPYTAAYALCAMWEDYSKFSKGQLPPAFNRRRCMAEWKGNRFPNAAIRAGLGWAPRVPLVEAMKEYCKQFEPEAG